MDIVGTYVVREQILRQLLSHTLRQRGDKHALLMLLTYENLFQQVVNLILARTYVNDGVEKSGGTDNLLYDNALSLVHLEVGRCGRYVHHLIGHLHKFLKPQRTVVKGGRQTESVFHKVLLAGAVATIHGAYLRHADVALVYEHEIVLGEEVEQTVRTFAWFASVEVARIVLNARTMSKLLYHLHVILDAFLDALRTDMVAKVVEEVNLLEQVVLNKTDGMLGLLLGSDKEIGRINLIFLEGSQAMERHAVEFFYRVYLVVPPCYAQNVVAVSHGYVHRVALDAERATHQVDVVADV